MSGTKVTDETREIGRALAKHLGAKENEWLYGPSGFSVAGQKEPISRAKAMKMLGMTAAARPKKPLEWQGSAGEWNAFVALVNHASGKRRR